MGGVQKNGTAQGIKPRSRTPLNERSPGGAHIDNHYAIPPSVKFVRIVSIYGVSIPVPEITVRRRNVDGYTLFLAGVPRGVDVTFNTTGLNVASLFNSGLDQRVMRSMIIGQARPGPGLNRTFHTPRC